MYMNFELVRSRSFQASTCYFRVSSLRENGILLSHSQEKDLSRSSLPDMVLSAEFTRDMYLMSIEY